MKFVALLGASAVSSSRCRFALDYKTEDIFANETIRNSFQKDFLLNEAHYVRQIGVQKQSQMARDGWKLALDTGLPIVTGEHFWTASSKESIHIALLVKVLWGDPDAQLFYTINEALDVLEKKIVRMEAFFEEFPGYGYYMPWVYLSPNGKIEPDNSWTYRTPALDNGEQLWPLWALVRVLRDKHPAHQPLADRYDVVVKGMLTNARKMFIQKEGDATWIRTESWFFDSAGNTLDGRSPVDAITYTGNPHCNPNPGPCWLDDPYEGEMMTVAMELLDAGLNEEEKESLWVVKRQKLEKATLVVNGTIKIDAQRGWYSSSHEQWKYLMLPYRNSALNWEVFLNTEKARTWYAAEVDPWKSALWGAMAGPAAADFIDGGYSGAYGIPEISFQPGSTDNFTPYGAFALMLASKPHGLAWLHNMLLPNRMQNCYGSTEGMSMDGRQVAPIITWDTKITTAMAVMGGIVDVMEFYMREEGLLDKFVARVDKEWSMVFDLETLQGKDLELRLPVKKVANFMPDWEDCVNDRCIYNEPVEVITEVEVDE